MVPFCVHGRTQSRIRAHCAHYIALYILLRAQKHKSPLMEADLVTVDANIHSRHPVMRVYGGQQEMKCYLRADSCRAVSVTLNRKLAESINK